MGVLDNARHERFAQELAAGKTADAAYKLAGYKADRHHGARLATKGHVQARVAEILAKAAVRTEITVERITDMLLEDRAFAYECEQSGPASKATELLGKLHGLFVERTQNTSNVTVTDGSVDRPPRETADEWAARRYKELGVGAPARSTNGRHHG